MSRSPRIAVIGAGLGGLAAAITLHRRGCEVTVHEQSAQLGEVGAGVQVSPNSMKVLRALGLEQAVLSVAFEPEFHAFRDWKSARALYRTPMKGVYASLFGAPYCQIHRADLHRVLRSALPEQVFRLGERCTGVRTEGNTAIAQFADGSSLGCDAVLGADGIHSAVRESLFGPDAPRFTGNLCWRGLVPASRLPPGLVLPEASNWMGPHGHVVQYYVRRGDLVNFVAVNETAAWTGESWSTEGDKAELLRDYAAWHPSLLRMFDAADRVFKWALYDREPLDAWTRGRVTLLGDAAHAMLPFMAQGAAMAIEDGYAFGTLVANHADDLPRALQAYEHIRRPRTRRVQLGARARMKENHLASPLARLKRNLGYRWRSLVNPGGTAHKAEWIYGHDLEAELAAL